MKKSFILSVIFFALMMQSCYTTQKVMYCPSLKDDLVALYKGKTKSYIIEYFPYSPTDIKDLGDGYEVLICKRWRNSVVGYGITRFYFKNGKCYDIETNEYKVEEREERVRIL